MEDPGGSGDGDTGQAGSSAAGAGLGESVVGADTLPSQSSPLLFKNYIAIERMS